MSKPKKCTNPRCYEDRWRFSNRNMCVTCDEKADQEEAAEAEQEHAEFMCSPAGIATAMLDDAKTLEEVKEAVRYFLTDGAS